MEITLTRQGVPWAKVLPISSENVTVEKVGLNQMSNQGILEPRIAGFWQGQVQFAGCWNDMSDGIFANFSEEINIRRQQAFFERRSDKTSFD